MRCTPFPVPASLALATLDEQTTMDVPFPGGLMSPSALASAVQPMPL